MPRPTTWLAALAVGVLLLAASPADAGVKNKRCVTHGWSACRSCCSNCECGFELGPRGNGQGCHNFGVCSPGRCDKPCFTTTVTTATTTTTTDTTTTTTIGVFLCEARWPIEQWEQRWGTYCASAGEATWAMTKDCTVAWQGGAEATALADCRDFADECVVYDTDREKCGRTRASTTTTTDTDTDTETDATATDNTATVDIATNATADASTTSTAIPYVLMAAGKCNSSKAWITTQADCEKAAAGLELFSASAIVAGSSDNPYGCYYKLSADTLYWNLRGNKDDDDVDRVSICNTVQAQGGGAGAGAGTDLGTRSNATNASAPPSGDVGGRSDTETQQSRISVAEQADVLFGAMDADKDGYIGMSELVEFCERKECNADALLTEIGGHKLDRATFLLAFTEQRVKSMDLDKLVTAVKAGATGRSDSPAGGAGGGGRGVAGSGTAEAAGGGGGGSPIGPIIGGVVGGVLLLVCVAAYLHNRREPEEQAVQPIGARLEGAQTFSNPAFENQWDGELEGVLGGFGAATGDGELCDVRDGAGPAATTQNATYDLGHANSGDATYDLGHANPTDATYDLGHVNPTDTTYDLGHAKSNDATSDLGNGGTSLNALDGTGDENYEDSSSSGSGNSDDASSEEEICVAAHLHNQREPEEQAVQPIGARLEGAQTFSNPAFENQRDGELEDVLGGFGAATGDGELYNVRDGAGGTGDETYEDSSSSSNDSDGASSEEEI